MPENLIQHQSQAPTVNYIHRSLVNHMSQGMLFINSEGFIITCNPAIESLFNVASTDLLYHRFIDRFADNFLGFSITEVLTTRMGPPRTLTMVTLPSGKVLELEVDVTLIASNKNPYEGLQGLLILIRDMTQLHRLQEIANRHNRLEALGEMAAMLAHQIRNPLGSIKGFASLLARDLRDQPALHRMATDIEAGADNLNRLVTNVLNYSRPLHVSLVETDLIALVRDLCRHVEADESLDSRIRIEFYSPLITLQIPIDHILMKSALLNIVSNAIQAMPEGGIVSISVEQEASNAILRIKDTGVGIASDQLKRLFQPFFTTKENGNGFGLAEVHRVIQSHAGTIEVESAPAKGTIFTITLPTKPYELEG